MLILLLYLYAMNVPEEDTERPYFYRTQVEKVKAIRQFLIGHISENFTQEELSRRFNIPMTAMKSCFRSVYGEAMCLAHELPHESGGRTADKGA